MTMRSYHPLAAVCLVLLVGCAAADGHPVLPSTVVLRAAILTKAVPLAYVDEGAVYSDIPFPIFQGFQPDLLRALQRIAQDFHNISLTFDISEAPAFSYGATFELVAEDCNTTTNPQPREDCVKYDFLVGDYYAFYPRPLRTPFTPPLLTTAAAAVKYVHRRKRDIATLAEAEARQEPMCLHNNSYYDVQTLERHPNIKYLSCHSHEECLQWLKAEECVLFVEDELQLRYLTVQDPELEVTREKFNEQFVLWPINARMDPFLRKLLVALIYQAKEMGVLDELYDKFFSVNFCPVGKSGTLCNQDCNPSHGISNRFGQCVCDSTRWTGVDCSEELEEDLNLLPESLVRSCYALVAFNFLVVFACVVWLALNRRRAQVKIHQPSFLLLILLGCVISTSTIIALAQEDAGDGPVHACMAIPWLYSVGFSITFGALFAKIRRIYILLRSAARMQRVSVTIKETALIVGMILAIDVTILAVWTAVDPLTWQRTVTSADKYGYPLESEGYCESEHWMVFAGIIAAFHLFLLMTATYMCYLARGIPNRFSNGKYIAIAVFSNFQIFLVAIPILVILGSDPQASFFVRSVAIWMNDLMVVTLIFGNLIYKVHLWDQKKRLHASHKMDSSASIQKDIHSYAQQIRKESSRPTANAAAKRGSSATTMTRESSLASFGFFGLARGASVSSFGTYGLARESSVSSFASFGSSAHGSRALTTTDCGHTDTSFSDFSLRRQTGMLNVVAEDCEDDSSSSSSDAPSMHEESRETDQSLPEKEVGAEFLHPPDNICKEDVAYVSGFSENDSGCNTAESIDDRQETPSPEEARPNAKEELGPEYPNVQENKPRPAPEKHADAEADVSTDLMPPPAA